jgi:hypothetical protein
VAAFSRRRFGEGVDSTRNGQAALRLAIVYGYCCRPLLTVTVDLEACSPITGGYGQQPPQGEQTGTRHVIVFGTMRQTGTCTTRCTVCGTITV